METINLGAGCEVIATAKAQSDYDKALAESLGHAWAKTGGEYSLTTIASGAQYIQIFKDKQFVAGFFNQMMMSAGLEVKSTAKISIVDA